LGKKKTASFFPVSFSLLMRDALSTMTYKGIVESSFSKLAKVFGGYRLKKQTCQLAPALVFGKALFFSSKAPYQLIDPGNFFVPDSQFKRCGAYRRRISTCAESRFYEWHQEPLPGNEFSVLI